MSKISMIHLNHPCYEVDLYDADPEEFEIIEGQGYMTLETVRNRVSAIQDILNNPEVMSLLFREAPATWEALLKNC